MAWMTFLESMLQRPSEYQVLDEIIQTGERCFFYEFVQNSEHRKRSITWVTIDCLLLTKGQALPMSIVIICPKATYAQI